MEATEQDGVAITRAISDGAVQLLREYTGRGPTKARTIVNEDMVTVLLSDTLTKGERKLVELGRAARVLETRHEFQLVMRDELVGVVEAHMRREVIAFMSANHANPDMAVETFILAPEKDV